MFESDDYDQILSQLDFPNLPKGAENTPNHIEKDESLSSRETIISQIQNNNEETNLRPRNHIIPLSKGGITNNVNASTSPEVQSVDKTCESHRQNCSLDKVSPKHSKRKIIDSHFDYNTKRKFPGPAGLLTGSLQENKDESVSHLEFFSQDIDFSQSSLKRGLFELPMWNKLKDNIVTWNVGEVDTIKSIKQQALAGNLRRRKAQTVTAYVETVDRSATDPLIVLRDTTGNIKCTLHRDAWSLFSPYLVAEHCALVLWKPTVLTTGSAFKKHYLNITLSNIYAIFSSAILQDLEVEIPDEYVKNCDSSCTVIRIKESPEALGANVTGNNETISYEENMLEDLDSIFTDDIF